MSNPICVYCHDTGRRPILKNEFRKIVKPLRDKKYVAELMRNFSVTGTIPCSKCGRGLVEENA